MAPLKNTEKSDGRASLGGKVRHNFEHTEYEGVVKNSGRYGCCLGYGREARHGHAS